MRFKSVCASAATAPNNTVATASQLSSGASEGSTSGKTGRKTRSNP